MGISKKKIIGLGLVGMLALSGTSVFAGTGGTSLTEVPDAKIDFSNVIKGEAKAIGEVPESARKGLSGKTKVKAGNKQVSLVEVEGVEIDFSKAIKGEAKAIGEVPESVQKQSAGKTTSAKK
ncbi:hypothetical protein JCM10914A_46710 [Paenibacillus sp. JCM 10914]|uniref:hypothetical protein n=1 Tax=Paenibacillus sp. JCM 10914 TaxID=1236974 RepID=UPI0003CC3021|nr:hypothetical protein [Paenibacillus sp. JCM 10914]GAE08012.1 hypothetical protein JCM10914_4268 [Paenibacillus sp. JCM 10914]